MDRAFHVYILTNKWHTVLYTGMTGKCLGRIWEHQQKLVPSFSQRYHLNKLVFADAFSTPTEAAEAERKIKGWTRKKKIDLIESVNPDWKDLAEGLGKNQTYHEKHDGPYPRVATRGLHNHSLHYR